MIYGRKNKYGDKKQTKIDGSMEGLNKGKAIQEVQSKDSLYDRIMFLENQLTQLSTEMDYRRTSYASSSDASCSSGPKIIERTCSYPIFDNPFATYSLIQRNPLQDDINKSKYEKKSQNSEQEMRHSSSTAVRQPKKNGDHKTSSNTRKKSKVPTSWPHLRLLGC